MTMENSTLSDLQKVRDILWRGIDLVGGYSCMHPTMQEALTLLDSVIARVERYEGDWQPIDTAPKDGTEIMVCDGEFIKIGSWYKPTADWCWWSDGKRFAMIIPTHWMPLPKPPQALASEGEK